MHLIGGFRFLSTPADFYLIFAFSRFQKTPTGFWDKKLRKNYFYFLRKRRLSFDPCRCGDDLGGQYFYSLHNRHPRRGPSQWRCGLLSRGLYGALKRYSIVGLCGIPKRYSIVRELKRRAGSRALRRPTVTLLFDISFFLLSGVSGGFTIAVATTYK